MKQNITRTVFFGSMLSIAMTASASSASIKELQGAWTMNGTDCGDTFKKVGRKLEFKDRSAATSTGILIDGSKVSGPLATCKTERVRKQKDRLSARLSCEDSMMESEVTETFKIISDKEFQRFDPFGDNMYVTYHKCDM